jgi:hypothetical protein
MKSTSIHSILFGALTISAAACGGGPSEGSATSGSANTAAYSGGFLSFGGRFGVSNCLDIWGDSLASGAKIDSTTCNDTLAQRFTYTGNRQIVPLQNSSYCLDVRYADYAAGVVELAPCNGTAAQSWDMTNGTIRPEGDASYCLDVHGGNTGPSVTVDVAPCNGTDAQLWWPFGFTTTLVSNETNPNGGLISSECLDVRYDNTNPGSNLDDYVCDGTDAQLFTLSEHHEITNHGLCLDVQGANVSAGVLHMQSCNGTDAQKWDMHGANDAVTIVNKLSGSTYCLDVYGNNATPGTTVDLAACNGTNAQLWHPLVSSESQFIE